MGLPRKHPFENRLWVDDAERDAWLADKVEQKKQFEAYRAVKRAEELVRRATLKTARNKLKANFVEKQILTADEADVFFGE